MDHGAQKSFETVDHLSERICNLGEPSQAEQLVEAVEKLSARVRTVANQSSSTLAKATKMLRDNDFDSSNMLARVMEVEAKQDAALKMLVKVMEKLCDHCPPPTQAGRGDSAGGGG